MHQPLSEEVEISKKILEANDKTAGNIRNHLQQHGIYSVNLMGSPGAGKTALLEKTIPALKGLSVGVVEGDIEGQQDRDRVRAAGAKAAVQINTYGACHLLAHQTEHALEELDLDRIDILFIENVGNLVCPAEFDLGESAKVMVLGVTEGADKPLKYPLMFRKSDLIIINKIDLAALSGTDVKSIRENIEKINPEIKVLEVSCRTGEGLRDWIEWLREKTRQK